MGSGYSMRRTLQLFAGTSGGCNLYACLHDPGQFRLLNRFRECPMTSRSPVMLAKNRSMRPAMADVRRGHGFWAMPVSSCFEFPDAVTPTTWTCKLGH